VSAAAKLCGFLVVLALIFTAAYTAGARLGPVTTGHNQPAQGHPMNMGAQGPGPGGRR
jgi:hypothetical protein